MQAIPGRQAHFLALTVSFEIHFEHTTKQADGLIFDPVELIAERLAAIDVQNLADIAIGMGPDDLVAPGFVNRVLLICHWVDVLPDL